MSVLNTRAARRDMIVQIIRSITDPILEPARRLIPPIGGLDFSPIVVLLLLSVLQSLVTRLF